MNAPTRTRRTSASPQVALGERVGAELREDLRAGLRGWYFTRKRQLPWRDDPTPYKVWVSEIMLQQTQVATVLPYFERFIATFPTLAALAAAPEEAVMAAWSGLGYYRRARHLHRAAALVMAEHGGEIPDTVEGLLALPGIGRYTAGAIASIAFGLRAPVLDGNVARVLSRVFAVELAADSTAGQADLWALAEALVPADASTHNQALMELGALVCSPRAPACDSCPLEDRCQARAQGRPEAFPFKSPKAPPKAIAAAAGLVIRSALQARPDRARLPAEVAGDDHLLFGRRPEGLLGGLWELPAFDLEPGRTSRARSTQALIDGFRERFGWEVEVGRSLGAVQHQFTHRTLTLELFEIHLVRPARAPAAPRALSHYDEVRWVPRSRPDEVPLSTLTRKVLDLLQRPPGRPLSLLEAGLPQGLLPLDAEPAR